MKTSRRRMEEFLWATGLHGFALSAYRLTPRGRHLAALQDSLRAFYRPLLPRDALVFDIGANMGLYSSVFSSLGTKVVALEPNSDCVRHILLSNTQRSSIQTLQAAAGPRNGLATISLSDSLDLISSMSDDWMKAIQRIHPDYSGKWSRRLTVPTVTLDTVILQFGDPYFIKIDVEGFEERVLDGLSKQPALLSFEFNTAYLEATFRCLEYGLFSGDSLFNFAHGDPEAFALSEWVGREELKQILKDMGQAAGVEERQGDIFVKQPEAQTK